MDTKLLKTSLPPPKQVSLEQITKTKDVIKSLKDKDESSKDLYDTLTAALRETRYIQTCSDSDSDSERSMTEDMKNLAKETCEYVCIITYHTIKKAEDVELGYSTELLGEFSELMDRTGVEQISREM
ncbi:MAG: hypothetical protein EZS28_008358, partial [Streblomastix strix]